MVANKAEGGVLSPAMQTAVHDAYAFGFPRDPVPVSAAHNEGISDLASAVVEVGGGVVVVESSHVRGLYGSGNGEWGRGAHSSSTQTYIHMTRLVR